MLGRGAELPGRAMGVNLVVFFAFALPALFMLSRTVISTAQIDDDVALAVRPTLSDIEAETALLPSLGEVRQVTAQLVGGAEPIGRNVSGLVESTTNIDATAAAVFGHVRSIGSSVAGTRAATGPMTADLTGLEPVVGQIHSQALAITSDFATVRAEADAIRTGIASIHPSLRDILRLTGPIATGVASIEPKLESIKGHLVNVENNPVLQLSNVLKLLPR